MKKLILVIFLMFVALNINLSAQSVKIVMGDSYVEKVFSVDLEEAVSYGVVKNTTDKTIKFKIRFEVLEIAPEHSISLCYNQCFDVVNIDYEVPGTFTLAPGQTSTEAGDVFSVHCYPFLKISDNPITYIGPAPGKTRVKVYLTNADDILDESEFEITFNIKDPTSVVEEEPSFADFSIKNIYPNPAKESTKIEFQYNKDEDFPHIELFDTKGNKLYNYELCKCEDFIYLNTKEFPNGPYYIQLVGKNKKSKNQMLLIQR